MTVRPFIRRSRASITSFSDAVSSRRRLVEDQNRRCMSARAMPIRRRWPTKCESVPTWVS
jgi:hypothetical protein